MSAKAFHLVRKEKPLPPAKPPVKPPAPTGIRAPGNSAGSHGMVCRDAAAR